MIVSDLLNPSIRSKFKLEINALLAVTAKLDSSYNSEAKPVKAYAANVIFFINTSMKRRFLYTMVLFSL